MMKVNWIIPFIQVDPIIEYSTCRRLCVQEYYNHKKGCPNYGKKEGCPPNTLPFDEVYDLLKPVYAILNVFNFGDHIERMKVKHSSWSKRQIECCLYWQGTARKQLKERIEAFKRRPFGEMYAITQRPEGMGVLVTDTMKSVDIELEWPPKNFAYQIAFAGILKEK